MLAAENREGKIVQSRTPAASQASMIASQRGRVISSGFSTTTCLPACAALTAGSMCAPLGVQTQTTSSPGCASIASRSSKTSQPPSASPAILAPLAGIAAPGRHHPGALDLVDRPRVELRDHPAADDAETVLAMLSSRR